MNQNNQIDPFQINHEKNQPHKCSICDHSASAKGNLKRHIEAVHEEKKPHECPICD